MQDRRAVLMADGRLLSRLWIGGDSANTYQLYHFDDEVAGESPWRIGKNMTNVGKPVHRNWQRLVLYSRIDYLYPVV